MYLTVMFAGISAIAVAGAAMTWALKHRENLGSLGWPAGVMMLAGLILAVLGAFSAVSYHAPARQPVCLAWTNVKYDGNENVISQSCIRWWQAP